MGITTGLFSDVLANAPQAYGPAGASGGSADWSRTLPMAGAVDWANVRPFQVINPLTGYNYGATQPTQPTQPSSSSAQEDKPQLSEYQKWLAQQSGTKISGGSDGGGGAVRGYQGPYTDKDWADIKKIRDELGWGNDVDVAGFKGLGVGILGLATGNFPSAMDYMYNKGKEGEAALRQYQAAMNSGLSLPNYRDIVNQMSVNGQGGFMAQPQPNATMSEAEQRAQYSAGVQAAREAEARAAAEAAATAGGGISSTVTPAGVVPSNPMGIDPAQAAVAKLNDIPAAPAPAPVNPFAGMFYDREYGGYVDSLGNFFAAQAPDTTASTGGGGHDPMGNFQSSPV